MAITYNPRYSCGAPPPWSATSLTRRPARELLPLLLLPLTTDSSVLHSTVGPSHSPTTTLQEDTGEKRYRKRSPGKIIHCYI